jgi:hypothetical protein
MAKNVKSIQQDLFNILRTRGFDPVSAKVGDKTVPVPQEADIIRFTFKKDGKSYGDAWATIDDDKKLIVYYDKEQQESPNERTSGIEYDDTWYGFLGFLKDFAQQNVLKFQTDYHDKKNYDLAQRKYNEMQEKLGESYHPMGRKASYNDAVPNVKIILQHNRSLEEGEARFRNVARIFLENMDGERFLAPTTRPGLARVYARHIAEGGVPNDDKWNHIKSICEDYGKLAGFVRATKNNQFNESAQELVNEGINHYNNLRETLHKLTTHKGYQNYFESYTPTLMEGDGEDISEMFMSSSMDPRIEAAMPILSRLKKPVTEMEEVDSLAEWADDIINEKLELDEISDKTKLGYVSTATKNIPQLQGKKGKIARDTYYNWHSSDDDRADADKKTAALDKKIANRKQGIERATGEESLDEIDESLLGAAAIGGAAAALGSKLKDKIADRKSQPGPRTGDPHRTGKKQVGEMDKSQGSRRDFDNARGPDKTAKPISPEQMVKGAKNKLNKLLNKAHKAEKLDEVNKELQSYVDQTHEYKNQGEELANAEINQPKPTNETLSKEQRKVGQLGPTEKITKKNPLRGKLVGANESKEYAELQLILKYSGLDK